MEEKRHQERRKRKEQDSHLINLQPHEKVSSGITRVQNFCLSLKFWTSSDLLSASKPQIAHVITTISPTELLPDSCKLNFVISTWTGRPQQRNRSSVYNYRKCTCIYKYHLRQSDTADKHIGSAGAVLVLLLSI